MNKAGKCNVQEINNALQQWESINIIENRTPINFFEIDDLPKVLTCWTFEPTDSITLKILKSLESM
jgi:hypothetical protein